MTAIEILRGKNGYINGFNASGHSGYAKRGSDIVCAAVSAILNTAVYGISVYLQREIDVQYREDAKMSFRLIAESDELTEAILATMEIGLRQLLKQYSKHIKMTVNSGF